MLVPPLTSEEQFELDWAAIAADVQGIPAEYTLNPTFETMDTALIPLICHRVKVQRSESTLRVSWTFLHANVVKQASSRPQWN